MSSWILNERYDLERLSAAEEREAFELLQKGKQAQAELESQPQRPRQEQEELRAIAEEGKRQRSRIHMSWYPYAVYLAMNEFYPDADTLDDRIQDANLGLAQAVDRFDPGRASRLSTYATKYIKGALFEGLRMDSGSIPLPGNEYKRIVRLKRMESRMMQEGVPEEERRKRLEEVPGMTRDRFRCSRNLLHGTDSLDRPVSNRLYPESVLGTLMDFQSSPAGMEQIIEDGFREENRRVIRRALDRIPIRNAAAVVLYFGLENGKPMDQKSVGRVLHMGKHAVSDAIRKGLELLRQELREYETGTEGDGRW